MVQINKRQKKDDVEMKTFGSVKQSLDPSMQ